MRGLPPPLRWDPHPEGRGELRDRPRTARTPRRRSDGLPEPRRPVYRIRVDLRDDVLPDQPDRLERLLLGHPDRQPEAELVGPGLLPPLALGEDLVGVAADQQFLLDEELDELGGVLGERLRPDREA